MYECIFPSETPESKDGFEFLRNHTHTGETETGVGWVFPVIMPAPPRLV